MILLLHRRRTMRPKKPKTTRSGDLFRSRLDQIINLKHELAQLAEKVDWDFIDGEIAPLYSDKGRPGIPTRFAIGLLLLNHIYGLSTKACASFQSIAAADRKIRRFLHRRESLTNSRRNVVQL